MVNQPVTARRPYGNLDADTAARTGALLTKFRQTFLRHTQIIGIERDLASVYHFGPPEAGCERPARTYLLVGESGAGKSTILKRFRDQYPPVKEYLRDRMEVVYAEVPASATRIGTMRHILVALGAPPRNRASEAELTGILIHHLREMGVRVLILDEAQHLVHSETGRFAYDTADWFKTLANAGIALVIAGLPDAALAYSLNEQLERRSMGCQEIQAFGLDGGESESAWMMLLEGLVSKMPLADTSWLLKGDSPHRLHLVTGGYLGRLADYLALIITEAGKLGVDSIDHNLLMKVEQKRRDLRDPDWINVFALVSLENYEPPQRDNSRRTRIRRGQRGPRQTDVEHPQPV